MATPEILVATSTDFSLLKGHGPVAAGVWDDVLAARAFKRDELTTDGVCVALTLRDGSQFVAHEEAVGWDEFLEAAEAALPGFPPATKWLPAVIQPAFARNETLLFRR
jgi:hypothetical protein